MSSDLFTKFCQTILAIAVGMLTSWSTISMGQAPLGPANDGSNQKSQSSPAVGEDQEYTQQAKDFLKSLLIAPNPSSNKVCGICQSAMVGPRCASEKCQGASQGPPSQTSLGQAPGARRSAGGSSGEVSGPPPGRRKVMGRSRGGSVPPVPGDLSGLYPASDPLGITPPDSPSPGFGLQDLFSGEERFLGWEIVRPAGIGAPAAPAALAMEDRGANGRSADRETKQFGVGTLRMGMQTGPANPLVLPADLNSVVYVVDASHSMAGARFERARAVLVDAVQQMQPTQKFVVILFTTVALRAQGVEYRTAGPDIVPQLKAELSNATTDNGTDPTDALLFAIQLKPQTIVVLSDGEFENEIVDRVSRLNRTGGLNIQINCIAIGTNAETLRRLTMENGPGNYIIADEPMSK